MGGRKTTKKRREQDLPTETGAFFSSRANLTHFRKNIINLSIIKSLLHLYATPRSGTASDADEKSVPGMRGKSCGSRWNCGKWVRSSSLSFLCRCSRVHLS